MADRQIQCLHCGKEVTVGARTVSTRCSHCYERITVEDFVVTSYHAMGNLNTCGSVSVTTTGQVWAPVKVCDLHVQGSINGDVSAQGKVIVEAGAQLVGNVDASSLEVEAGATLKGFYRIVPKEDSQGAQNDNSV